MKIYKKVWFELDLPTWVRSTDRKEDFLDGLRTTLYVQKLKKASRQQSLMGEAERGDAVQIL